MNRFYLHLIGDNAINNKVVHFWKFCCQNSIVKLIFSHNNIFTVKQFMNRYAVNWFVLLPKGRDCPIIKNFQKILENGSTGLSRNVVS